MAIQFRCPACNQRIEIDDEFAGRRVQCPYCQSAADAPLQTVAEAQPVAGDAPPRPAPTPLGTSDDPVAAARLGLLGVLCGVLLPPVIVASGAIMFAKTNLTKDVRKLMFANEAAATQPNQPELIQKNQLEFNMDFQRASRLWWGDHAALAALTSAGIVMLCLVGLGSSIAGLIKSRRYWARCATGICLCVCCGSCGTLFALSSFMIRGMALPAAGP
jgi:hypothetical protein